MKRKLFVLFLLALAPIIVCKAQTYTGCIIQNSGTYSTKLLFINTDGQYSYCGGTSYALGGTVINAGSGCSWIAQTATERCSVNGSYCGLKATYVNSCSLPLDTLSLVFVFIAAGYGYYIIRKTNVSASMFKYNFLD